MLLKNKNAWFLILGGSLVLGTNFTIAAVLQLILKPFDFTNVNIKTKCNFIYNRIL